MEKGGAGPPAITDFSQKATGRAVLHSTLQHPLTVWPTTLGIVGWVAVLMLDPSLTLFATALGTTAVGLGSWAVNYFFRRDAIARRYLENLHRQMQENRTKKLAELDCALKELGENDGGDIGEQGREQFQSIQKKLANFRELLEEKLDSGELTFTRYMGTAEQVTLSVLDNLATVVSLAKSASTIDEAVLAQRIARMKNAAHSQNEIKALTDRIELKKSQSTKIQSLLAKNEEAMTQLDKAAAAIAELNTDTASGMDLDTARQALEELVRRAPLYATARAHAAQTPA